MIYFSSDYIKGCHPRIWQAMEKSLPEARPGYGEDPICREAAAMIRAEIKAPEAAVHFLTGGTQTNLLAVVAFLRPHEGALCAGSGHINVHESGAIEATGHKVLPLPSEDGKITAEQIDRVMRAHRDDPTREHTVKPGMIYLSNTTELGTVYRKAELEAIAQVARSWGLPIYMDGARLASALAAPGQDLQLADLPHLLDAFSIGGTKNGLLFGEALVLVNKAAQKDFRYIQKQRGAMLAKGWLLGVQYRELFSGGLYQEIGRWENELAQKIATGLTEAGCRFALPAESNQLFVILTKAQIAALEKDFVFEVQATMRDYFSDKLAENEEVVRFCTSFATSGEDVEKLLSAVRSRP